MTETLKQAVAVIVADTLTFDGCSPLGVARRTKDITDLIVNESEGYKMLRRAEPTPEALEAWAEWFDNPNKSPSVSVQLDTRFNPTYTPGYLLREIARRLRAAREE